MTEAQINGLNYDKGACTATDGKVALHALGATTCNFACKNGYYHDKGDAKIAFTCAPNGDKTRAEGTDNWGDMAKCQGA